MEIDSPVMGRVLALVGLLALSGCIHASPEARYAANDQQCRSYGVLPGSPGYVECRLRLDKQRADQRMVNSTSPVGMIFNAADQ